MVIERPAYIDTLYDIGDAELVKAWQDAIPEFQRARMILQTCEGELVRRMGDRLALETEAGTVERQPQLGEYQWDIHALDALFGNRLVKDQLDEVFKLMTTVKVSTTAVKKYAKRLGIPESELERCYFRAERKQDLEFHPPQKLLEQLEASVAAHGGAK